MNNEIKFLPPFKRMCMTIGTLPSSFYASMSYYESMVWLYEYLKNEVIPVVNNNSEVAEELQTAFTQLENYIEHYFENLDIQQEVDAKLDEMAEDGTLADMIAEYIKMQGQLVYNNVAEMKLAENIQNGSFLKTYGYYTYNDGGGALYKARTITNEDVIDNMTLYALHDNTLVAELIEDKELIAKQLGIHDDNETDDSNLINSAIVLAQSKNKTLKFTKGTYIISEIDVLANVKITGEDAILKVKDNLCTNASENYYIITLRDNTTIENITIDGNKENNTLFTVADLLTTQGDNITINNNKLINVIDSGIMFSETINSKCTNNTILDSRDAGIYCNNNNSDKIMNSLIQNNIIKNAASSGIAMKRGCRYLDIKDNYILNCTHGITNEQASTTTDFSKEFNIINNTIYNQTQGSYGIDTRGGYNSNIIGNRIINYLDGILVQGSHDLNIKNNIIEFNATSTLTANHYGIILTGRNVTGFNICYNINVINNIINETYYDQSSYAQTSIRINSSDNTNNINITGNTIKALAYGDGITTSSNVNGLNVQNNTVEVNASKAAFALQGCNCMTNNKIISGTNSSATQYYAEDIYHRYFTNGSTSAPTAQSYYKNGDVVFAKYGSSSVFAWTFDGTNFKAVNFD